MRAYYNENNPFAAQWLRNLIEGGLIADGDVDVRDIRDVQPGDLRNYSQCHFFAGIGGWSLAGRMAGLADDFPVWTGSCPCQPYSSAGKQKGNADDRDLWPVWFNLLRQCRPPMVFGEQVASAIRFGWLDRLSDDMEGEGYAVRAAVLRACSIGSPHQRARLYFGAKEVMDDPDKFTPDARRTHPPDKFTPDARRTHPPVKSGPEWNANPTNERGAPANPKGVGQREPDARASPVSWERARHSARGACDRDGRALAYGNGTGLETREGKSEESPRYATAERSCFSGEWRECADGKSRLFAPRVPLLAHGLPSELAGAIAGFGNAIVPQVAAEFIEAWLECAP